MPKSPLLWNGLFICKNVEAPKVTLGILFWIVYKNSVQICGKKLRCIFYLLAFLENTCFVCISMGNGPVEGAITCNVKHKRFITQKRTLLFFFWFLQKMSGYYSLSHEVRAKSEIVPLCSGVASLSFTFFLLLLFLFHAKCVIFKASM